ncbi:hypothetical protein ACQKGD_29330 [Peribacillus frigoritolerans]|uniref:hypothetical protein n=1 Tax=Peribacillus frigoritolerans TaxID=450367 RepID=UPI003D06F151
MKNKLPFLLLAMLMLVNVNVNAETSEKYSDNNKKNYISEKKYSDNSKKNFINANEFYKSEKTGDYREYKTATLNIREKLLYKDLKSTVNKHAGKYSLINIYINKNRNIDPKRQIYLFCSIKETEEKMIRKYLIIDAETQKFITEGHGERRYH